MYACGGQRIYTCMYEHVHTYTHKEKDKFNLSTNLILDTCEGHYTICPNVNDSGFY